MNGKKIMKRTGITAAVLIITAVILKVIFFNISIVPEKSESPYDLSVIEKMADAPADKLPLELNRTMIVKSIFPNWAVIAGGAPEDFNCAMTAYQVVYSDKKIVIDPACTEEQFIENNMGGEFTYYKDNYLALQKAMTESRYIIATHEHYDHVGAISASPHLKSLLNKIVLTEEQLSNKWISKAGFTEETVKSLTPLKYGTYHTLLPGIVLIKSPGHTPGHQMIFIKLKTGGKILLVGDVVWQMVNLKKLKGRPLLVSLFLREDRTNVANQIRWIHDEIYEKRKDITLVVYHDYDQLEGYVKKGIIGDGFK